MNSVWLGWTLAWMIGGAAFAEPQARPNVVMLAVDDMCDWIGPMGHAQAITPNMDRLAVAGVTFQNAHTAGSFCAPSRSALFSGRHATTTGCYTTQVYFHDHPEIKPLQQTLQDGGYATYGAGKLFHHPAGYVDLRGWDEFFLREEALKQRGWDLATWSVDSPILPQPYPNSRFNADREPANRFFLEWGKVLNEHEEAMADTLRTEWACELIRQKHDKPVFVAVGLYTPHFPNYAPAKYFDLYDRDRIELPPYLDGDLDDLPPAVRKAKTARGAIHRRLEELDAVEDAIHGYLACISYADAMLGRLLDAIASGPNADNTVVVLWSDHGYHHGEKLDWGKHTLWERTSNVPYIWAGPGIQAGQHIETTVSLIDLFPSIMDLCSLPKDPGLDGISLAGILGDPTSAEDRHVMLPGMKPGEYAMINQNWRYIRYADGGEELYHVQQDPNEWQNLAAKPEFAAVKARMTAAAPTRFAKPGQRSSELKLVTEGSRFSWTEKRAPAVKRLPGKVPGVRMTPRASNDEARMDVIRLQGRKAWKSTLRPGQPSYFYFCLDDPAFQQGHQPAVQVTVTYLDRGNTGVVVEYDSSDPKVNVDHPKGAGAFKVATQFQVKNSGAWKRAVFNIDDAHFARRCNDGDLRVGFARPHAEPVLAEIVVKARR